MERKETIKKILCTVFSFLLSVMLFVTTVVAVLQQTLLDRDYFADMVEKSGYVDLLHEQLVGELANEGYVSGFDEVFFEQIITTDMVKAPVLSAVDEIYGTGDYKSVSKEQLAETLSKAFVDNLESREVEVDEEQKKHIDGFAYECADFLSKNARLPFISIGESLVKNSTSLVKYALVFVGIFALFCVVFLAFTSPKSEGVLRYYSYSFGGATLMTATPVIVLMATGIFKKISIADKALYYLVQTVADNLLNTVLFVAIVFAVIWIFTALVTVLKQKQ